MQTLSIIKINSKPYEGQYGLTNKVGILTKEYGEIWLNGFVNNLNFKAGDNIFAEVEKKGEFMNFKYKGKDEKLASQTIKLENKQPDWDKIRMEKTENIRWLNALNNACLLIANGKIINNEGEPLINLIKSTAMDIYRLEPTKLIEDENGGLNLNQEEPPF